jgi:hypothetical protein
VVERLRAGFGSLDPSLLEEELRVLAGQRPGTGVVDDLELRHLVSVILHGALLLQDLYESERVGTIYTTETGPLARTLLGSLLSDPARPEVEILARARRLPDEVRQVGDKCLFDVGITGIRRFRGLDLESLGTRAYRMASEILMVLAEDRRLREFFEKNRMSPLPLEEEVAFLRQCGERFGIHADLLHHLPLTGPEGVGTDDVLLWPARRADSATGVAMPARREWSERSAVPPGAPSDFDAPRLSRDDLLSAYERILLFSSLDIERLKANLNAIVVDQPAAVETIGDEFALTATGTQNLIRPPSYFLVGPTGVGKNHLVETLVKVLGRLWEIEIPLLTIDGPNYTDPSDINELRGSTRGFVRSDEEGLLAEFHTRASASPISFILVDEVEKAHAHLRKFFLPLMDRGTVTDNRGRALSFSNSMLFFTSNLGFSQALERGVPIGYRGADSREEFEKSEVGRALRQALSAEFMNRVRIVRFEHLSRTSIERIFDLEFDKVRRRFAEVHDLEIVVTDRAREEIFTRGYSHDFGARHLASVINQVANVEVSKRVKRDDASKGAEGGEVLDYLRQLRSKVRAFDPREVRARVLGAARVRVPYRRVTIDFESGSFLYRT